MDKAKWASPFQGQGCRNSGVPTLSHPTPAFQISKHVIEIKQSIGRGICDPLGCSAWPGAQAGDLVSALEQGRSIPLLELNKLVSLGP